MLLPSRTLVRQYKLSSFLRNATFDYLSRFNLSASTSKIPEFDSPSDAYHYNNHVQEKNGWSIRVTFSKIISNIRKSSIGQVLR